MNKEKDQKTKEEIAEEKYDKQEAELDEEIEETFPASDPPQRNGHI